MTEMTIDYNGSTATIDELSVTLDEQPFATLMPLADLWYAQENDHPEIVYSGTTKRDAVIRLLQYHRLGGVLGGKQ